VSLMYDGLQRSSNAVSNVGTMLSNVATSGTASSNPVVYRSTTHALRSIFKYEGPQAFYKGFAIGTEYLVTLYTHD
jgi:hypothetical protein